MPTPKQEPKTVKVAKPTFKIPKKLAECADRMYTVRHERYAAQKLVDALQAEETALQEHLINNLPKSLASGIAGKVARASIESKTVYRMEQEGAGWPKLYAYIVANFKKNPGVFALLQRRLGEAAAKEMIEAGTTVPGVVTMDVVTVSLNKL